MSGILDVRQEPVDVAILGGGISGLAAAYRLYGGRPPPPAPRVRLLEASPRLGGSVRSLREDGCLFESACDSVVTQKPAAVELCRRLGIEDELLPPRSPGPGTFLVHRGRLAPLPEGFVMMVPTAVGPLLRSPLLSPLGKARLLAERYLPRRSPGGEDESLASFVRRRCGAQVYDRIVEPFFGGLYTADADRLSARHTAGRLVELEARYGSVTRGLLATRANALGVSRTAGRTPSPGPAVVSLRDGMGRLIDTLEEQLPPSWISTSAECRRLEQDRGRGLWSLEVRGEGRLQARSLILACPAWAAARLLRSLDPPLAGELESLEYASCATVSLLYDAEQLRRPLEGFGFFVPRTAGLPILACSYASAKFEQRARNGQQLFRVFAGGAMQPALLELEDSDLVEQAHAALAPLVGLSGVPAKSRVFRHYDAMPQFHVGESDRIARTTSRIAQHDGLFLAGSALGAYGLPDCIRSGEQAADAALAFVGQRVAEPAAVSAPVL